MASLVSLVGKFTTSIIFVKSKYNAFLLYSTDSLVEWTDQNASIAWQIASIPVIAVNFAGYYSGSIDYGIRSDLLMPLINSSNQTVNFNEIDKIPD